jgi:polysaccharide chain length determinant protein (PEP-CTERM system associated)
VRFVNPYFDKLLDEVLGAWRYRWLAFGIAFALALAGWLLVFMLPDRYEARASVLVDTRTALKPALEGLATQQDVGVELSYVRESLLTDQRLLGIARTVGLLPSSNTDPAREDRAVSYLLKHVQLTKESGDDRSQGGTAGGTSYGIRYQDTNRARALNVVSILLQTLIDETLGGKRQGSESAQQFLESQVKDYEKRLRTAEDRLAEFKSHHFGLMPSERGGYFEQLQKETAAVEEARTKLIVAQNRRDTLEKQLHGDAAVAATAAIAPNAPTGGAVGMDTVSRIAQTRAHLDELLLKYTDKHPDVIETRKNLAELERRRTAEIESLRNGDAGAAASSGASANPVYQSIQLELNHADVDIADLRTQLGEHEEKARQLRQLLNTAPQVEAEFAQLNRDYDVNKAQYTALLASFEKARLGERADSAGSVKFQVIEPPLVSMRPVWPSRAKFLTGVLLAALAAGVVIANRLDRLRPMVGSQSGLTGYTGVPLLAAVGSAFPTRARGARRWELLKVSTAAACLLLGFAAAVVLSRHGLRLSLPTVLQALV